MKTKFSIYCSLIILLFPFVLNFNSSELISQNKEEIIFNKPQTVFLRVKFSTNSDWSILKWESLPTIKTMRLYAFSPDDGSINLFYDQIKIAQALDFAYKKRTINVIVDYLLEINSTEQLKFEITKGSLNSSSASFYILKRNNFVQISEVKNDVKDDNKAGKNPKKFSFEIKYESLNFFSSQIKKIEKIPKLALAFYYLWYNKSNWEIFPLKDEPLEFYSSEDEKVIENQIKQARMVGLDGFITSWDGPNSYSDFNFKKLLKICKKNNFKTAIYLETLTNKGPRNENELFTFLKYLFENYSNDPSIIKIFNKPLIFIWASNEISIKTWKNIFKRLEKIGIQFTTIGMTYDLAYLSVFDGLHQYGIILFDNLGRELQINSKILKNYHLISNEQKIWTATIQPGYDERTIPKRPGFFKERNKGKYYEYTFNESMKSKPDFLLITSWNEWWENTHIEPSKKFGTYYLDLTKKFIKKWKLTGSK